MRLLLLIGALRRRVVGSRVTRKSVPLAPYLVVHPALYPGTRGGTRDWYICHSRPRHCVLSMIDGDYGSSVARASYLRACVRGSVTDGTILSVLKLSGHNLRLQSQLFTKQKLRCILRGEARAVGREFDDDRSGVLVARVSHTSWSYIYLHLVD
jgi:hypothetical protein